MNGGTVVALVVASICVLVMIVMAVKMGRDRRKSAADVARRDEQISRLMSSVPDDVRPKKADQEYVITRLSDPMATEIATPVPMERPGQAGAHVSTPIASDPTATEIAAPVLMERPSQAGAHVSTRIALDATVGEALIKAASFTHGVRRALSPDALYRIRYEMGREVRRARKQRRRHARGVAGQTRAGEDTTGPGGRGSAA